MIFGAHAILYSKNAEADRAFFRDVLGFPSVDAHDGWLIFALPPAELACHPSDANDKREFFLMCDDLDAQMAVLRQRGVDCSPPIQASWGRVTQIVLPGGGELGLYQPRHATALGLGARPAKRAQARTAARPRKRAGAPARASARPRPGTSAARSGQRTTVSKPSPRPRRRKP